MLLPSAVVLPLASNVKVRTGPEGGVIVLMRLLVEAMA